MNSPIVTILDGSLCCPICKKNITALKWGKLTEYENLQEVDFIVEHPICRSLTRKKSKLTRQVSDLEMKLKNKKNELLNLEYRLYQEINEL